MNLESLLAAIHADPSDDILWSAIADRLEEQGETDRAELTRLTHLLRRSVDVLDRAARETRMRELLASGVKPCVAEITNSIGMRLVCIPPGEFLMGSPEDEAERLEDEGPQRRVRISKAFYLGVFAVTQAEYEKVMGTIPSYFSAGGEGKEEVQGLDTSRFPVETVNWKEAVRFCKKLSKRETKKGRAYRLPTEAEWEYACRAGTTTATQYGNCLSSNQANINRGYPYAEEGSYFERPCEVGNYQANAFGLHDMLGNVSGWCSDRYDENAYTKEDNTDPKGGNSATFRVLRGGCWAYDGRFCRSASRSKAAPGDRYEVYGFRVVCGSR